MTYGYIYVILMVLYYGLKFGFVATCKWTNLPFCYIDNILSQWYNIYIIRLINILFYKFDEKFSTS